LDRNLRRCPGKIRRLELNRQHVDEPPTHDEIGGGRIGHVDLALQPESKALTYRDQVEPLPKILHVGDTTLQCHRPERRWPAALDRSEIPPALANGARR